MKNMVNKMMAEVGGAHSLQEMKILVAEATMACNRYSNRSGFSPLQRVLGYSHRLPRSVTSDDPIDPHVLPGGNNEDWERAQTARVAALRAFAEEDSKQRLGRAAAARSRTRKEFARGDVVYVCRRNRLGRTWQEGLGVVLMTAGASSWISMRGALWKVATENLRHATSEEKVGA